MAHLYEIDDDDLLTNSIRFGLNMLARSYPDGKDAETLRVMLSHLIAQYAPEDRERFLALAPGVLREMVDARVAEREAHIEASRREAEEQEG